MTSIDLLWDGAREGLAIQSAHKPRYTKEQFLKFWEELCKESLRPLNPKHQIRDFLSADFAEPKRHQCSLSETASKFGHCPYFVPHSAFQARCDHG